MKMAANQQLFASLFAPPYLSVNFLYPIVILKETNEKVFSLMHRNHLPKKMVFAI